MAVDDLLAQYGLVPSSSDAPAIRGLLSSEIRMAHRDGDELLKTLCVQLFAIGDVSDSLLIWQAKQSSFDAACYIDIQLLCGAGLLETKQFLAARDSPEAKDALRRICECEAAGDFEDFGRDSHLDFYGQFYGLA